MIKNPTLFVFFIAIFVLNIIFLADCFGWLSLFTMGMDFAVFLLMQISVYIWIGYSLRKKTDASSFKVFIIAATIYLIDSLIFRTLWVMLGSADNQEILTQIKTGFLTYLLMSVFYSTIFSTISLITFNFYKRSNN